ncbi:MAG: ATPase domain-containing protein [Candidatus Bathyarchaeia archaeon]
MGRQLVPTGVEGLDAVLGGGFPKNSLILLAGNPGTGKTVFSACFLYRGCVDYGEKGVYVSLAESRDSFYENMKAFGYDFKRLESKGRFRFLDMLTVKEPAINTVLNMIVEEAENFKAKRLVLDSYSALAQAFKDPMDARIVAHTILGKLIRMMGCTTILIEEVPIGNSKIGFGVEEFVADGVIKLNSTVLEGHRFRELELLKLRGIRLKEHILAFTLDGGFRVFQPFKPNPPKNPKRFQPVPDMPDKYSTGSKSLDEVLDGGLPKSSFLLLEVDEKISTPMYHLLVVPLAANYALHGRGVFIVPSIGVDPAMLHGYIRLYGDEDCWMRYARIIVQKNLQASEDSANIIHVEGGDWRNDIGKVLEESRKLTAETRQPSLSIIGVDTLTALYGEKQTLEALNLNAVNARKAGSAAIAIVKAGIKELAVKLSPIADIYLRLKREHGCLLLYGVKPRTGLYAVEPDTSAGYPIPKLTPIV